MTSTLLDATTEVQNMNLDTGIPVYILVPAIMVIAIVSVIAIRWIYKKMNKN